jgi:hypothetical protein
MELFLQATLPKNFKFYDNKHIDDKFVYGKYAEFRVIIIQNTF